MPAPSGSRAEPQWGIIITAHESHGFVSLSPLQIATTRRLTVHFNPPSSCVLEISVRGVKIAVKADDSKENSKVAPCSLLVLSLLWLLTPAPCATGHVCI